MKEKKSKALIALLIFILISASNIFFSTLLHNLLSGKSTLLNDVRISDSISSIISDSRHRMLFLSVEGFALLAAAFYFVGNNKPYQSDLVEITPDIFTPKAAGQGQHGTARWLTDKEKNKAFYSYKFNPQMKPEIHKGGIVLGMNKKSGTEQIYIVAEDIHTLCIGATRSGKSRTVVLQTICTLALAGESMISSDPKGELFQYTSPFLKAMDYDVHVIDFKNPLKSSRYNFLQPVIDEVNRGDIAKARDRAWDITDSLVGEPEGEPLWTYGEASVIASAIITVVYENKNNPQYQNMTNVYYFISEMCRTVGDDIPLNRYLKTLPDDHPAKALFGISEIAPSKTRGSFFTSALTTLRLFTNPSIYSMTNACDFSAQGIGSGKSAVFFILPDEKTTYYSLASLMVSQTYELLANAADENGGRLKNRVNFILDEFGNFTQIPDFDAKLTVGGGRGMRFNLFLQGFSQLDKKYGKETASIVKGNCQTWIYLQSDDMDTLKEFSEKLGTYTTSSYQLSASHQKYATPSSSHSLSLSQRNLLNVDEVRLVSRPYQIVTSRTHPAMMYSPDLSKWYFNGMLGLGNEEHNIKVRIERENERPVKLAGDNTMELWGIWDLYNIETEQDGKNAKNTAKQPKEQRAKRTNRLTDTAIPYIKPNQAYPNPEE